MVVSIVAVVVGVLLLASRWVQAAKPFWAYLPKSVAVLLPAVVAMIPQVIDLLNKSKTWDDLVSYGIAAAALVAAGLAPSAAHKGNTDAEGNTTSAK